MNGLAELLDLVGRAGSYVGPRLRDRHDRSRTRRAHAARRGTRRPRSTPSCCSSSSSGPSSPTSRSRRLLADDRLAFARHHLRSERRYRPHLLTEPEEVDAHREGDDRAQRVRAAVRGAGVEHHASSSTARRRRSRPRSRQLHAPDREVRRAAAEAVTKGLEPGLRTRAFVLNTLLADKSVDDRLRHFDSWIASRNLANEASDESVQALVDAVQGRYSIPQRWYALKARLLGIDRLADYDRMASVADVEAQIGWRTREGARARRVRIVLGRARRHRAALLRRRVDRRARAARASGPARSARTPCRRTTRTCC